jgi:hypothetical protein
LQKTLIKKVKKIIDVSGFGHSGKSAVSEFLVDHEDFFSFPINVEFELFRVKGGLLDLYYSIFQSWSLIRSKNNIEEFQKLVKRIGTIQFKSKLPSLWQSSGHGYNQYFNNRFIELSKNYINSLIVLEQNTFWPYEKLYLSHFNLLIEKIKEKLVKSILNRKVFYTDRNSFLKATSNYVHSLFDEIEDKYSNNIVLNNAFEPYKPVACLEMVENSFSIVVDRDPRDIYASLINSQIGFVPKFEENKGFTELKKKIVGLDNIDDFILRYKTIKGNVDEQESPRLLRIRYEDFVLKHEVEKERIYQFLGITKISKKENFKFNPDDSKKNIGLWKLYSDLPEIQKIQIELAKYCYQN